MPPKNPDSSSNVTHSWAFNVARNVSIIQDVVQTTRPTSQQRPAACKTHWLQWCILLHLIILLMESTPAAPTAAPPTFHGIRTAYLAYELAY